MNSLSLLQKHRLQYQPKLPSVLQDFVSLTPYEGEKKEHLTEVDPAIRELFPYSVQQPIICFQYGTFSPSTPLKVGVVFSGGQAPGGHNVITGLFDALKKLNPSSQLIGFLDGPSGIIKNQFVLLTDEVIAPYRNQGGFDLIGSGRTKIETSEQYDSVKKTLQSHQLDGLVIIGGDDSNTIAAYLAEFCHRQGLLTRIIGVPKTIDGDLKNNFIEISFGFDTASKIYSEIIGNLLKDALSAKKYYFFVKMMGRSASHITLECALQTHVNLALIGEEIASTKQTLKNVVDQVANLICERAEQGKNYGVILIPEGLLEFIPECHILMNELNRLLASQSSIAIDLLHASAAKRMELIQSHLSQEAVHCYSLLPEEIQKQLLLERDPHGNIQLSKIETERLLVTLVQEELNQRKKNNAYVGKFNPQPLFCGYEGRSALPSNFDCQYCYALGHVAAILIRNGASGYMCCIQNLVQPIEKWEVYGVPIVSMLHFEIRKNKKQAVIQKALVNLEGSIFKTFKNERNQWRLEDIYSCPGPIQFDGPIELTDNLTLTLLLDS